MGIHSQLNENSSQASTMRAWRPVLRLDCFSFRPAFLDTAKKERRVEYEQKLRFLSALAATATGLAVLNVDFYVRYHRMPLRRNSSSPASCSVHANTSLADFGDAAESAKRCHFRPGGCSANLSTLPPIVSSAGAGAVPANPLRDQRLILRHKLSWR